VVTIALEPMTEPDVMTRGWVWGSDPQGAVAARLQIAVLPTVLVIGADGEVVGVIEGYSEDTARLLRDTVAAAASRS
jgi:hypothetical protein